MWWNGDIPLKQSNSRRTARWGGFVWGEKDGDGGLLGLRGIPFGIIVWNLSVVFRFFWQSFFFFLVATAVGAPLGVVINEIHYHPKDKNSAAEFIELFNAGGQEVDLSGWQLDLGVRFTFPPGAKIAPAGWNKSPDIQLYKFLHGQTIAAK